MDGIATKMEMNADDEKALAGRSKNGTKTGRRSRESGNPATFRSNDLGPRVRGDDVR